jgi:hypothetical protein
LLRTQKALTLAKRVFPAGWFLGWSDDDLKAALLRFEDSLGVDHFEVLALTETDEPDRQPALLGLWAIVLMLSTPLPRRPPSTSTSRRHGVLPPATWARPRRTVGGGATASTPSDRGVALDSLQSGDPRGKGRALQTHVRYDPRMDPDQIASPERTEQLRRSMAMLAPGQLSWLTRDDALMILAALEELQRRVLGRSCCHPDEDQGSGTSAG